MGNIRNILNLAGHGAIRPGSTRRTRSISVRPEQAEDSDYTNQPLTTAVRRRWTLAPLGALALFALTTTATAEQVSREQDIQQLRLGQHILVDDGSCQAGEIKEIFGAKMTATGVLPVRRCISRLGPKKR